MVCARLRPFASHRVPQGRARRWAEEKKTLEIDKDPMPSGKSTRQRLPSGRSGRAQRVRPMTGPAQTGTIAGTIRDRCAGRGAWPGMGEGA